MLHSYECSPTPVSIRSKQSTHLHSKVTTTHEPDSKDSNDAFRMLQLIVRVFLNLENTYTFSQSQMSQL